MLKRYLFQINLLIIVMTMTTVVACTSVFGTELSNGVDYSPLGLEIKAYHASRPCAKAGESLQIRFIATNRSNQPFVLESSPRPVMNIIVEESPGMEVVFDWAAQNPDKVQHRIEWQPGESKVIELTWVVPEKEYVPGEEAVISGLLSEGSKIVQGVPVSPCLGIPFEQR